MLSPSLLPVSVRRVLRSWFPRPRVDPVPIWKSQGFKWFLDASLVNDNGLAAHAWVAVPPSERRFVALGIDGVPFPEQTTYDRPDVHADQPAIARAGYEVIGLTGHSFRPAGGIVPGACYRIEIIDRRTGKAWPGLGPAAWHRIPQPNDPPLPDAVRRQRVHGQESASTFETTGVFVFKTLETILAERCGRTFESFGSILDWGCGSGRVMRYFHDRDVRITGADVDADNVAWCQANLPFAKFETIPLHPPTRFPDASFDLAFGVSIFTHLTEPVQFEWLDELRRIVKPGGILLMSFHGINSVAAGRISPEQGAMVRRNGFLDLANRQYDADLAETEYYRNTFHSEDYIRRRWGQYFEIIDLLPSALTVQDMAVMRRR